MSPRGGREPESGFEVRLDNRRIFLLAFTVLVLVVLAFAVGYVVGRRSGWVTAGAGRVTAVTPPGVAATPLPASIAPSPAAAPALPDVPAALPPSPTATRAPSPTAPPAVAPTVAPARRGWSVQIGAFGERSQALASVERLKAKGRSAYVVEPAKGEGKRLWRVRVGPFPSKAAADTAAASLARDGVKEPMVREE